MKTLDQLTVRTLVRAREDFQSMRKKMDNRIGRKADGSNQNRVGVILQRPEDILDFKEIADSAKDQEKEVAKKLKKALKRFEIYNQWLSKVDGVGEIAAGWIIGEIDIEEATTVSKIRQYAGFNPGQKQGKKRISADKYKESMGPIVQVIEFGEKKDYIYLSNQMIKGDRPTPGFILPYNKNFKTALIGILATAFIKANGEPDKNGKPRALSPYRVIYDQYKARLEQSENTVLHKKKGQKEAKYVAWKDVNDGHRNAAAKRYMIKAFLQDLYVQWRTIEGLPVRPSYQEEKLGHRHLKIAA